MTKWEDLGPKAITALASTKGAMDSTVQSAQKLNEIKYNSFGEAVTGIGRQIQTGILLPLGEAALPMLTKFSQWFATEGVPKIKAFADMIQAHMPQIEATVTTVFTVLMTGFTFIVNNLDIIIPLVGVFGAAFAALKIAAVIQAAITAFTAFRTAIVAGQGVMAAFNLVCAANPISLIVIAVAAVIAILIVLYNKCDGFRAAVNGLWEGIKGMFTAFVAFITPLWNALWEGLKGIVTNFSGFFKGLWEGIKAIFTVVLDALKLAWNLFWEGLKIYVTAWLTFYKTVWEGLKVIFSVVIDAVKVVWTAFVEFLSLAWQGFQIVWNTVCEALKAIITPIIDGIKVLWDNFLNGLKIIWDALKTAWDVLCQALKSIIDPIIAGIKALWDGLATGLQTIMTGIQTAWNTLCQALNSIITPIIAGIQALWNGFKTAFDTVCSGVKSAWDTFTGGVTSTWNTVVDGVKSAWEGIKAPFQSVVDSISGIWQSIKNSFKLPHFTFSGSMNPLNWADEGTPSIGVDWYAKGGIMTQPTMFGMNGGNAMVGGEAGPEAILPLNSLFTNVRDIVSSEISKLNLNSTSQTVQRQPILLESTILLDGAEVGRATASYVSEEMAFNDGKERY